MVWFSDLPDTSTENLDVFRNFKVSLGGKDTVDVFFWNEGLSQRKLKRERQKVKYTKHREGCFFRERERDIVPDTPIEKVRRRKGKGTKGRRKYKLDRFKDLFQIHLLELKNFQKNK